MIDHAGTPRSTGAGASAASVILRPAVPGDHDQIVERLDLSGSTRRLLHLDLAGEKPRHGVVALDVDGVIGFAMSTRQPDEVHLLDIAVAPSVRRRGIATRLLTWLAAAAMAEGATAMTLEVRASNPAAQALYTAAGFVDHGTRPGYYQDGEDAVIMWHHDLSALAAALTGTSTAPTGARSPRADDAPVPAASPHASTTSTPAARTA